MINSTNIQWPQAEDHVTGDRGTMALGVKDVDPGVPEVIVATEDFETDPISGSGTWTITLLTPHSGLRCLRSGVIGVSSSTDYTFNIPATATHIRFWWRVSCENNADFFRVYKDAIIPGNLLLQGTGLTDVYAEATLDVTGATTVTFRYIKDSSLSGGLDRAIIDDIEWIIPGIPAIQLYEPFHLNLDNEIKVTQRPLDCATDSVTVCIGDVVAVSGTFEFGGETPASAVDLDVVDDTNIAATLSAANPSRRGWFVFNDSTEPLFIKYGAGATRTDCNVMVLCGGLYEMPLPIYQGEITGVWLNDSIGGVARVTELT